MQILLFESFFNLFKTVSDDNYEQLQNDTDKYHEVVENYEDLNFKEIVDHPEFTVRKQNDQIL